VVYEVRGLNSIILQYGDIRQEKNYFVDNQVIPIYIIFISYESFHCICILASGLHFAFQYLIICLFWLCCH
jgi:hypothetical protein